MINITRDASKLTLAVTLGNDEPLELPLRPASDFNQGSVGSVRVATPEEAQRHVDALNNQPRGTCVKTGCTNERAPWRVIGGIAAGSAFCVQHFPKVPV